MTPALARAREASIPRTTMTFTPSDEEDKYFAMKEAERRDKIRSDLDRRARELQTTREVAVTVGTDKPGVLDHLRALGFDADTGRVFDLLPLVYVAWADGTVSGRERKQITRVLHERGIEPDSHAAQLIAALLEKQPSAEFLEETVALLREIVSSSDERSRDIVDLCVEVAEASGGLFGIVGDPVSEAERELIAHIADQLGESAQSEFQKKLG